jgi:hypothetical protein
MNQTNKDKIKKNNEYVLALYRAGMSLATLPPSATFFPPRPMAKNVIKKEKDNVLKLR